TFACTCLFEALPRQRDSIAEVTSGNRLAARPLHLQDLQRTRPAADHDRVITQAGDAARSLAGRFCNGARAQNSKLLALKARLCNWLRAECANFPLDVERALVPVDSRFRLLKLCGVRDALFRLRTLVQRAGRNAIDRFHEGFGTQLRELVVQRSARLVGG